MRTVRLNLADWSTPEGFACKLTALARALERSSSTAVLVISCPNGKEFRLESQALPRVCSYDRAGYGDSDAGPMPRTSAQIATELHSVLQASGEKPPYVLVGHSFGGYNARVFTGKYPSEVAGIVLADSPQEDQYKMLPAAWEKFSAALRERYRRQADTAPLFIGLGIAWLMLQSQGAGGKYDYLILQSKYLKARASELENMQSSAEEARSAGGIVDKPLIVQTSGKTLGATFISGLNAQGVAQYERTWVEDLQPRLV
jgi:pimeloyl-ACP methyl ester carboxylesterase